jgi:glycosyltransferase involved in cell wall biosynthesis
MGDDGLPERTRLGPPGVDVHEFRPRERAEAAAEVRELAVRLQTGAAPAPGEGSAFSRDEPAAGHALAGLDLERGPHVAYVGKLIVSKGVDLLAAAWPLVLREVPDARLVVVGFGGFREGLERLLGALAGGDLVAVRDVALAGREAEGGPRSPLRHLLAFVDRLAADDGLAGAYRAAAAGLGRSVVLTGRLEHDELAPLLAASEAQVVPSTFPEAFGMVAAEAAACGTLPLSASHSGLAEVTAILAAAVPEEARDWLAFDVDDRAVEAIAERLVAWLRADPDLRRRTRAALERIARERFSWEGVAAGVVTAAEGRLEDLPRVPSTGHAVDASG